MKDTIKEYKVPIGFEYNNSKKRYYDSLVPEYEALMKCEKLAFHISVDNITPNTLVNPQNNINKTHLFKPTFTISGNTINVYVSSYEVLNHTLKALAITVNQLNCGNKKVEHTNINNNLNTITKDWKINAKVIICRIESFLTYLEIKDLLENDLELQLIKDLIIKSEMSRLEQRYLDEILQHRNTIKVKHKWSREDFLKKIEFEMQNSTTYIQSANIVWNGVPLTLIGLPWGYSLSKELLARTIELNPDIQSVSIIGGVGYIGTENVDVDDVFIPNAYINEKGVKVNLQNHAWEFINDRQFFSNRKVITGTLKTLIPNADMFYYTDEKYDRTQGICAYDMEFMGFMKAVIPGVNIAATFYLMDKELDSIHLGDTYYHEPFLKNLYNEFYRGKFNCFEIIEKFVLGYK